MHRRHSGGDQVYQPLKSVSIEYRAVAGLVRLPVSFFLNCAGARGA
jgi:hypothetical protein